MPSITWPGPPLFSTVQASAVLQAIREGKAKTVTSFDLNRTETEVELTSAGMEGDIGALSIVELKAIVKQDRKVFRLDRNPPEAVQVFSETTGWIRSLCPTKSAPTVLVSGIPMHRIKETDPRADTLAKIRAFGKIRGRVLDTATGLGYTAIEASLSAQEVVTVEIDPTALEIAKLNPWSQELFSAPNITRIVGDVFDEIRQFASASFEGVIHDPPTPALGGELYGIEFYGGLRRILRRGGRLFHYVGDPEGGIGRKMIPGIVRRLSESGFHRIERHPDAFGLTAIART